MLGANVAGAKVLYIKICTITIVWFFVLNMVYGNQTEVVGKTVLVTCS